GPTQEVHPALEDGCHVGAQIPPGEAQGDNQSGDGPEVAQSEPLRLEQGHAEVDEHGDGDGQEDPLDHGHTRSSPRISPSIATVNAMTPSTTRKSAIFSPHSAIGLWGPLVGGPQRVRW